MYYEDLEFCARLNKSGLKVVVTPLAEASHIGGSSSSKSLRRPLLYTMEDALRLGSSTSSIRAGLRRPIPISHRHIQCAARPRPWSDFKSFPAPRRNFVGAEGEGEGAAVEYFQSRDAVSKIKEHFDSSENCYAASH